MKQASISLFLFFSFCSLRKRKQKFLLRGYLYIGMDVVLHEETRSGYENEKSELFDEDLVGEPRCLYRAHNRSRIRILSVYFVSYFFMRLHFFLFTLLSFFNFSLLSFARIR